MEIPNYELNEWLEVLELDQRERVQQLVEKYGAEEAIDKWILGNSQTKGIKAGGDGIKNFIEKYKNEINKFICGHPDYDDFRKKFEGIFDEINKETKAVIVSGLSAIIGSQLNITEAILAPIIVLSLYLAGTMGVKAYCSGITFE